MNATMDRLKLLDLIRAEHDFLMRTLAALTDAQMVQPVAPGEWSVKDILAHITFWEQQYLSWLAAAARGESPDRPPYSLSEADVNAINERAYLAARDRPLPDVLAAFLRSYEQILAHAADLSEEVLFTPGYYDWLGSLAISQILADNTLGHYAEHAEQIRRRGPAQ
jgi:hypothetical protein